MKTTIFALLFCTALLGFSNCEGQSENKLQTQLEGKWYTKYMQSGLADVDKMYPEESDYVPIYFISFDKEGMYQEDQGCYFNTFKYTLKDSNIILHYGEAPNEKGQYEVLLISEDKLVLHRLGEYESTISYTRQPNGNKAMGG